jgi:SAM-dependent methyltransferase
MNNKWPKKIPELTEQQKQIREDFMIYWHKILPKKFSIIEKFNHIWAFEDLIINKKIRTLEIGAGLGEHINFENLELQDYYALELRKEMSDEIVKKFPKVKTIIGDIQNKLDFKDNFFDRIIAVHVLEHLPDLPSAINEIKRLLKNDGFCDFIIPCEGSFAYSIARKISAERIFKKRYKMPYNWLIKIEHINNCKEIVNEIKKSGLKISSKAFFPFPFPFLFCNLVVKLKCYL